MVSLQVDKAMSPGLLQVTWTSLNLRNFLTKGEEAIANFEKFSKKVYNRNLGLLP